MMKTNPEQKKLIVITVLGIAAIVLAAINRFFLNNIVVSGIIVTLSIIFFVAFIWFKVQSRRQAVKEQPKQTKQKPKK
jgi:heme/copper-type cytochrome/quinol oxidase subunit 2